MILLSLNITNPKYNKSVPITVNIIKGCIQAFLKIFMQKGLLITLKNPLVEPTLYYLIKSINYNRSENEINENAR